MLLVVLVSLSANNDVNKLTYNVSLLFAIVSVWNSLARIRAYYILSGVCVMCMRAVYVRVLILIECG